MRPETAYVRSNGQVTLPVQVRRAAELQEGDIVEVSLLDDGTIGLRPVDVMDRLQADLLFRLGDQQPQDFASHDVQERARELVRRRQLPVATGRKLEGLVGRYQRGELTRKAFVGEAVILGLPPAPIAALLADSSQPEGAEKVLPQVRVPKRRSPAWGHQEIRIAQAFHSMLYLPLYVAHDVGFFAEQGLEVEITTAGGGPEAWSTVESGLADYAVHDPVFAVRAYEQGVEDAVVVGTVCNGQAIVALAADPTIQPTEDPRTFVTDTIRDRTVATQPEPDSQWALLRFLRFLYQGSGGPSYRGLQVPIGTETRPVLDGDANVCLAFPPQAELGVEMGLHEVFDFSQFFGPYLLSALVTRRSVIKTRPKVHGAMLAALEKACQYAHAFPSEAVRVAQREFPTANPAIIESAATRCLRRNFLPLHVAVDGEAWQENGVLNKFVGTIGQYRHIAELVDNEAGLHAYRALGNLRMTWERPMPIRSTVAAENARRTT